VYEDHVTCALEVYGRAGGNANVLVVVDDMRRVPEVMGLVFYILNMLEGI
jgi:hypothetical protein